VTLSGEEMRLLAEEQSALRRVATLVARGVAPEEVFAAVTDEVGRLLSVEYAHLGRYESDGTVTFVAASGGTGILPVGTRLMLGGKNVSTVVAQTGLPARIDSYSDTSGPVAVAARERGVRLSVGTPIAVEGHLWGVMVVGSTLEEQLPADTEARLAAFTELLATAIANAEYRVGLARLAEEQAALRRIATLVARGVPSEEVFAAVAGEVGQLFSVAYGGLGRYESDGTVIIVAGSGRKGQDVPVGRRWRLGGRNINTLVFETGRAARIDGYDDASGPLGVTAQEMAIGSGVGIPVIVDGHVWGVMAIYAPLDQPLPANTEARLASFTELVASAIANAESRAELAQLAEEQAALRRVATLVARRSPPEEVFSAVIEEVGRLLPVDLANLCRYEPDGTQTFVATWGSAGVRFQVGSRWPLGGTNLGTLVFETGRPARIGSYADASGPLSVTARGTGLRSAVATPIIVEGRLWGMMGAGSSLDEPLPPDTEARLASFTELVAMAIANAESRAKLAASRARIVAAADETRRRIERDLHDGTQQRLVSLMLDLRAAEATQPSEDSDLRAHLARAEQGLAGVIEELREISRGIHPAILSKAGLGPAIKTLARRSAVPVEFDLRALQRLPSHVEVAAYYAVSEALTNAAKHACASVVTIEVDTNNATLQLMIRDDGVGNADPSQGTGLVGLADRIEALGGRLQISSPAGSGTSLSIEIPINSHCTVVGPEP
jgi:signal transduction histidine kinase